MSLNSIKTAAKNALAYPKAKRGDVAVIERVHTSTDLKRKKTEWKTYELIKVTKTSKGKVISYVNASGSQGIVHSSHRVMIITDEDKQAAARDLFGAEPFDSIEAMKTAILDRAEALR